MEQARQLMRESLVWENHACMPVRAGDTDFLPQLQRLRDLGVNLVILNISFDHHPWHHGFRMLATFRQWLQQHDADYLLVQTVDDIARARESGRLGVCFDLEGAVAVDDMAALVEPYYALGVRWMLLAYNRNNRLGGGCQDDDTGLTAFGREVIDEMQRVGMVLCCSHTGHRTVRDAIEYSSNPVIFSHSNAAAVHAHERNIPDDLIRACAASGGVVNINGVGDFLGENDASSATYVRHVQHVADLVGPEHVGIGLDFVYDMRELDDYLVANPELFPPEKGYAAGKLNFVAPEQLPEIVDLLMRNGWDDAALRGFLGENNLRVAKAVWR